MSISALNWALNISVESSSQKLVLMLLANYADEQARSWPSQKVVAEKACLSVRSVVTALAELEKAGIIRREARWRPGGSRGTDVIHLNLAFSNAQNLHQTSNGADTSPLPKDAKSDVQRRKICTSKGENAAPLATLEPPLEPSKTRSEAIASAPTTTVAETLSDRDRLWFEGKLLLMECSLSENMAGKMIGHWRKAHPNDDARILWAIRECRQIGSEHPQSLVPKLLGPGPDGNRSSASKGRRSSMVAIALKEYGPLQ